MLNYKKIHMKKTFLFLIFISIIGCGKQQVDTNYEFDPGIVAAEQLNRVDSSYTVIDVSNNKKMPHPEFHKILKDVKYIPLKSEDPIGIIDIVKIHEGRVFILDHRKSESIFIFDLSSGELIKRVHDKGQGPAEYAGLADMAFWDNQIVVNDRLAYFTLYYTLDGEFIKKEKGGPNLFIEVIDGTIINQVSLHLSSSGDEANYQLLFTLEDSIIKKGFPLYPIQDNAVNGKSLWYNNKNELLFCPMLSDTVYQIINDSSYFVKYVIKQKKSIWEKKDEHRKELEYSYYVKNYGYTLHPTRIFEVDDYIYYPIYSEYNGDIVEQLYLYNKTTGISFVSSDSEPDNITTMLPRPLTVYKNYFVGIFEGHEIEALRAFIKQDKKSIFQVQELKSLLLSDIKDLECILVLFEFSDIED